MPLSFNRRTSPDAKAPAAAHLETMPSATGVAAKPATNWRGRPLHKTDAAQPPFDAAHDPELAGKHPKRSSSFGMGLGGMLANGMTKAGESLGSKKAEGAKTPPGTASGAFTPANGILGGGSVGTAAAAPSAGAKANHALPDPSHLAQYSLKLSELVNKAFVPCTGGSHSNGTTSTTGSALAGAAKSATALSGGGASMGAPALSAISYEGRKLPSKAVILEVAHTVVAELDYAASVDAYLLRAASRASLKALTLFATRIDSLLVSPTKDPSLNFIPTTAKEGQNPPGALEYNLGLVALEWIVEDALERCIEGPPGSLDGGMPHFVSEILTPVRKKMEGTILHVIQPLFASIKSSMTACLSKAVPTPFMGLGPSLSPVSTLSSPGVADVAPFPGGQITGSAAAGAATTSFSAAAANASALPSGLSSPGPAPGSGAATPSAPVPSSTAWLKELEGRLEGARRLLVPRIEERCGQDGEGWYISVAIHVIWKGLMILTSRVLPMPASVYGHAPLSAVSPGASLQQQQLLLAESSKRSPSPAQLTSALKSVSVGVVGAKKDKRADSFDHPKSAMSFSPSGQSTPNLAAAAASFSALGGSCSWSAKATAHLVAELQAFEKLIIRFSAGFQPSKLKPLTKSSSVTRSAGRKSGSGDEKGHADDQNGDDDDDSSSSSSDDDDDDDEDELARAALAEALHAIKSTIIVAQNLETHPEAILDAVSTRAKHCSLPPEVSRAAKATPHLILLHLVYSRMPIHLPHFAPFAQDAEDQVVSMPSPPGAFGYKWADYERAIGGFVGGESWAVALVNEWKEDIQETEQDLDRRERALDQAAQEATKAAKSAADFEDVDHTPTATRPLTTRMREQPQEQDKEGADEDSLDALKLHRSTSATGQSDSSDSLPDIMTNSAPTLDSANADAVRQALAAPASASSSQHSLHKLDGSKLSKKTPWASLALKRNKSSQSAASSNEISPAASPETSPPQSPPSIPHGAPGSSVTSLPGSVGSPPSTASATTSVPAGAATAPGAGGANQTRPKRFWRPNSSQNVSLGGFHLPSGIGRGSIRSSSPRGNGSKASPTFGPSGGVDGAEHLGSAGTGHGGPMTEEERLREEMRIERAALRFLKKAVDGVAAARTHGHSQH
ncbi:hypothetical protein FA10DRAFT_288822 [Acaromyces ingoldii]|uniref:Uncharacterized protein n=1 Tax=Acaromyces ingoldii TaxID=215250 RepID=A0A316YD07_9BASI|nr:hypothetical protein FA10DRAFT_288822 [Acaromyces ingoldii]PWN87396.1 hypothetical protein FA10DRAFT_288822 [Acaromyces ingoldii]